MLCQLWRSWVEAAEGSTLTCAGLESCLVLLFQVPGHREQRVKEDHRDGQGPHHKGPYIP